MRQWMTIGVVLVGVMFVSAAYCGKPRVVAHRGFWKWEGSAQNSIASLRLAARCGLWGSEFDVNVTSDGVAVVYHDAAIDGKRFEQAPYADFREVRLRNGERLPTLAEYLAEGKKYPKLKLILEIKSARSAEHERRSVEIIMREVEQAGVARQVEYIAFSRRVVEELLRRDPKLKVAYLNGDIAPQQLKEMGCPGLDYSIRTMRRRPEWFGQARKCRVYTNVWTVNRPEDIRFVVEHRVGYITTDKPLLVEKVLRRK